MITSNRHSINQYETLFFLFSPFKGSPCSAGNQRLWSNSKWYKPRHTYGADTCRRRLRSINHHCSPSESGIPASILSFMITRSQSLLAMIIDFLSSRNKRSGIHLE
ncbi:hypothetical protein BDV23DRAFT_132307 [Aspergillus alliaceus]|uniref:Uncharacterized protein n=1 Tax=Petromyces alliaceus TaxID=209559 RepID=A0A5N7BZZ2_PETAA|nr:hypothetical protein BDV23DRAFT_132307 [Aspergillus alliaceus]